MRTVVGSIPSELPYLKELLDYWLTRVPRFYLVVERLRRWINWDKRLYLSLIKRGDNVIDVGANAGGHTILFSHLVGENGKVVAFEPVPANFETLGRNVRRRARFSNIEMERLAIGNPRSPGEHAHLHVPGSDLTQASLVRHSAGSWTKNESVSSYSCPISSLDTFLASRPMSRVDLIKIDVEGGELDVLRGAAATIATHRPFIYCEVFDKWASSFGYTPGDLLSFVRSAGYSGARVIDEKGVHSLDLSGPFAAELFSTSCNVLFFTPERARLVESFDRIAGAG